MREHKRDKKDHSGLLAFVVFVLIVAGVAFFVASPAPSHNSLPSAQGEDVFYGTIENLSFQGQTKGTVQADTNCKPVNGLTNCVGIIITTSGTELHFNYTHDMTNQACLSAGDLVTITQESSGNVKVVRG